MTRNALACVAAAASVLVLACAEGEPSAVPAAATQPTERAVPSTHAIRNVCALVNDGANNDDDNACAYVNA